MGVHHHHNRSPNSPNYKFLALSLSTTSLVLLYYCCNVLVKSDLEQEEEYEDHCGGGRVGGTGLPVPVNAVYKVVDAQKQTGKGLL